MTKNITRIVATPFNIDNRLNHLNHLTIYSLNH